MKKLSLTVLRALLIFLTCSSVNAQQKTIPGEMFGINWQLTDSIGSLTYLVTGGKVNQLLDKVAASGPKIIRVGGNDYDRNGATFWQIYKACDSIINQLGADPIVTIPIYRKYGTTGTFNFSVTDAVALLDYLILDKGLPIKYISLGNEPDFYPNNYDAGIDSIASKFKRYVKPIKLGYPQIKVVGPSLADYFSRDSVYTGGPHPYPRIIKALLGGYTGSYANDTINGEIPGMPGVYYLDILDWHDYAALDNTGLNSGNFNAHRDSLINYPKNKITNDILNELFGSSGLLNRANLCRPSNKITFALTEMNVNFYNPPNTGGDALTSKYKNSIYGIGCHSFLAGQYWASVYMEAMKSGNCSFILPWSIHESGGGRGATDFGYLNNNTPSVVPRSTYYHMQMLTQNFNTTFCPGTITTGQNYIRAFGSLNSNQELVVMVLNMDTINNFQFAVRLDNSGTSFVSSNPLGMKIDGGINKEYTDSIENQSTLLLTFDLGGNLIKRCKYEMRGHTDSDLAPTCTEYCVGTTDAFLADYPNDNGYEPSSIYPYWLTFSEDIWVRNEEESQLSTDPPQYANEFSHQNPEWTNTVDSVPYVYVKVRNRACDSVSGTLHLYYTRASLGDKWSMAVDGVTGRHWSWEEIDTLGRAVVLGPGEDGTYEFKWDSIAIQGDPDFADSSFCLIARFISANDTMYNEQDSIAAGWNAQQNNNIIQKNVVLVDSAFNNKNCVLVTNMQGSEGNARLEFFAHKNDTKNFLDNGGRIFVDLGQDIFDAWDAGGKEGFGVRHNLSNNIVEIIKPDAYIGDVVLDAWAELYICFEFIYLPGTPDINYNFDVREFVDTVFTGAERYIIPYPDCPQVEAGATQTVGRGCPFELQASPRDGAISYTWTIFECPGDTASVGDTVGVTSGVSLSGITTTTYMVTMKLSNGCYSTDKVRVNVNSERCRTPDLFAITESAGGSQLLNCSPNPAIGATTFHSIVEQGHIGEIRVTNIMGQTLGVYYMSEGARSVSADFSSFNSGIYFYSLYVDGKLINTKRLMLNN